MAHAAELLELLPDGIVLHDGDRIVAATTATLLFAGAERRREVVGQPVSVPFKYPHQLIVRMVPLPQTRWASEGEYMPSGRSVTMAVQDTGDGISADVQYHRFEQLHLPPRRVVGGALGLSAAPG
jgi:hypothetical protein